PQPAQHVQRVRRSPARPAAAHHLRGTSAMSQFTEYVQPRMGRVFTALGLDVEYERAEGNTMYHRDERGELVPVLDLMGGYGSLILGHNHPGIVAHAKALLDG